MGLHQRIATALGWPLRDVHNFSLASLREIVRPVDPSLAREITETISRGAHIRSSSVVPTVPADLKTLGFRASKPRAKPKKKLKLYITEETVFETPELKRMFVKGAKRRIGAGEQPTKPLPLKLNLNIDRALSPQEAEIRDAAHTIMNGGDADFYPIPREPNTVESHYLRAIESFRLKKMVFGIDHLERGDKSALLRYGRGKLGR